MHEEIAKAYDEMFTLYSRQIIYFLDFFGLPLQINLSISYNNNNNNNRCLNRVTPSVTGLVSTGALYNVKIKEYVKITYIHNVQN